ncbi:hypothetical protein FRC19_011446 [Serendipita sp. 401]|nr:hypothetical protein FRC19_011446 [Serendipita sp. 401]
MEDTIRHLRVVHPYRFLEHESGSIARDAFPPDNVRQAFREVTLPITHGPDEESIAISAEIYIGQIKEALQLCCPTQIPMGPHVPGSYFPTTPLKCVDVRGSLKGLLRREPDLFMGFDIGSTRELIEPETSSRQRRIHNTHGIPVFVHCAPQMDIRCSSENSPADLENTLETNVSVEVTLHEMRSYLSEYPWRLYPHRFSYCIVVAGPWLRLWKWEIGGCEVSDAIRFQENPTVIYRFLQLIGELPYYGLGIDVGTDGIFQTIPLTLHNHKKMLSIISLYHFARETISEAHHWKAEALARGTLWKFKKWDVSNPDPEVRGKRNQVDLVVLSHPIYTLPPTYYTRCYLAVPEIEFRSFTEGTRTLADINVLKISWKPMRETPALVFYRLIKKRRPDVPYIPTVLAGGCTAPIRTYLKSVADTERGKDADENHARRKAEMKMSWLLMKEVGALSQTDVRTPREVLKISYEMLEAIRQLDKAKILHRNISPRNILVNLVTRDCLLVDFSMALDNAGEKKTMSLTPACAQEVIEKLRKRLSPTAVIMNETEMGLVPE